MISKSDLLQTILPEGFSATRAVWLLRAQLGVDDDEWSAGARALSLLDGRETREGFGRLIRSVYPESDDEDDDGGCAFTEVRRAGPPASALLPSPPRPAPPRACTSGCSTSQST